MEFKYPTERNDLIVSNEKLYYGVPKFEFMKCHKGLRPGQMHLLLGSQGKGKSTLARSVLFDLLRNDQKVLWISSEESGSQLKTKFAYAGVNDDDLAKIYFIHEDDLKLVCGGIKDFKMLELYLRFLLIKESIDIVFFDNVTTSIFYDNTDPRNQTEFCLFLRKIMIESNRPWFCVAHTGKNVKDSNGVWIDGNDIRGVNTLSNKAENLYVYRQIKTNLDGGSVATHAFVMIEKCRDHSVTDKVFHMEFDYATKQFTGDKEINFLTFKKIFEARQRFSK